jgi:hypothetical protein
VEVIYCPAGISNKAIFLYRNLKREGHVFALSGMPGKKNCTKTRIPATGCDMSITAARKQSGSARRRKT